LATEEPAVKGFQEKEWVGVELGGHADGTDEESNEHSGLETFSGDVAGDDEKRAVGCAGDDLEEVAADVAGGAILAGNGEAGVSQEGLGEDDALDFLSVFDVEGESALGTHGEHEAA
jgi:hypothetical protein